MKIALDIIIKINKTLIQQKKYLLPFIVSAIVSGCGSNDKGRVGW